MHLLELTHVCTYLLSPVPKLRGQRNEDKEFLFCFHSIWFIFIGNPGVRAWVSEPKQRRDEVSKPAACRQTNIHLSALPSALTNYGFPLLSLSHTSLWLRRASIVSLLLYTLKVVHPLLSDLLPSLNVKGPFVLVLNWDIDFTMCLLKQ
jgi:hypothetical protein